MSNYCKQCGREIDDEQQVCLECQGFEDLMVEIPKKYRKQLSKRFSISNFSFNFIHNCYYNDTTCILCDEYSCGECPFNKFETKDLLGCIYWMWEITNNKFMYMSFSERGVLFDKNNKNIAKYVLGKLKDGAKKYIKWV